WTELHDATARNHRVRLRGEGMREVRASLSDVQREEIADQRRHLSGTTPAGREVVVAEEPATLLQWAERMGSCIASYDRKLVTGRAHLLGVYEGEKLIANAEVRTGDEALRLVQLRGRFNRDLPGPAERDVVGFLSDAGVDCLRRYAWGCTTGDALPGEGRCALYRPSPRWVFGIARAQRRRALRSYRPCQGTSSRSR